jgi:hypothetical protein
MGPDDGEHDRGKHPDVMLDDWLCPEDPEDRRDDLYDGEW